MLPVHRRNSTDPALYVKRENLFTTKNSSAVYQDSDNREVRAEVLEHVPPKV
jgi:hypothetical protein